MDASLFVGGGDMDAPFRPILGATKHPALGCGARDTYADA